MRSLLDPPGFTNSTLTSTVAAIPSVTERKRTRGVFPTRSSTDSAYFMRVEPTGGSLSVTGRASVRR